MFSFFKKKEEAVEALPIHVSDTDIVAVADGTMIPLEQVKDEVFAQKMMGDGVAFELKGDVIYAPCNGTLAAAFPTGHAFGFAMKDGVELLIHIGINTVNGNGDGFQVLAKQGQEVSAGIPLVKLDLKKLRANYDMTTMLIITAAGDKEICFIDYGDVTRGQKINK
ncbi:MAG: PTS glucose transporter subunit IIA [Lachnospiraceae bacterium]|nr:PTS glucose transporter subunit IIA [Lachnospiraceae bacterium]